MLRGKILGGILSAGLLLAGAGWASADCCDGGMHGMHQQFHRGGPMGPRHEERHPDRGMMGLRSRLNLTDEQRTKIRDIVQSSRDQMQKTVREMMDKRLALQNQVRSDKPDEKAIRSAADELAKAIGDRAVLQSKIHSQIRGVLTDDQRKTLEEFRQEHREMMDRMFDHWLREQAERPQHHEEKH
ncbi:MAG: Spy/CpxP family protein refolding chaperone [Bacillota bacterium]